MWCSGCHQEYTRIFIQSIHPVDKLNQAESEPWQNFCADKLSYMPDTVHLSHFPVRYLRVNFHIMNNAAGTANFEEEEGRAYINRVLWAANERLKNNNKLFLPPGNNLPVLPIQYRLVLTPRTNDPNDDGIYFHYDDTCFWMVNKGKHRNLFDNRPYDKYGVQKDTVLNIFLMAHHPDSLHSPTYQITGNGIARFTWLKLMTWKNAPNKDPWESIKLLHHEIGHCLGLLHAWTTHDGCADTPAHPNCWHCSMPSPCDSLCSNNIMDYNAYMGAWSPCQIATIHYHFSKPESRSRKLLRPDWCMYDASATINIEDSIFWRSARDLAGDIRIRDGGVLTIGCRVSLPKGAVISVEPGGTLFIQSGGYLHNACQGNWRGIQVWLNKKRSGKVLVDKNARLQDMEYPIEFLDNT